jgi:hypothetical protein
LEKGIYDEYGQLIIEASEWYMRDRLQEICNEHNKPFNTPTNNIGEFIKEQFIKIEDSRTAICEAVHDCEKCPLNSEDKCGELREIGIFNPKTMRLEPTDPEPFEMP